jgi:Predicted hydrolases or acyltransferases (alpha/beta hydrolase superfamily)
VYSSGANKFSIPGRRSVLLILCVSLLVTFSGSAQLQEGYVKIKDGNLYYVREGTGPPLIFLHGLALDHRAWQKQADYFSHDYSCISVDLRGFGKSSLPITGYSFHEDINTLLDSLHINEPVILVAHSMGGRAAVNFSLAYPGKTKALVLADVVIDGYRFEEFKLEPIYAMAREKGIDSANQFFLDNPIFESARRDSTVFRRLREMLLSYSGWQWLHKNPVQGLIPPAIEQLDKIKAPVLIITGENDIRDFQQVADILHKNIKHSLKKEISGAGHMCNMEKPAAFNSLVSNFLSLHK